MAIDIGPGASDRTGNADTHGYTILCIGNPANASGTLSSLKMWSYTDLSGLKVGTFYLSGDAGTYTCRDSETVGAVVAGAERTFVVDLDVQIGDIIGFYCATGIMEQDDAGDGIYYKSGDCITTDEQNAFSGGAGTSQYSIYATGTEGAVVICTASAATGMTDDAATLHGATDNLSVAEWATRRGFAWDTVSHPDPDDPSEYASDWHEDDVWDADMEFSHEVSGLDPGQKIYWCAYIVTAT